MKDNDHSRCLTQYAKDNDHSRCLTQYDKVNNDHSKVMSNTIC